MCVSRGLMDMSRYRSDQGILEILDVYTQVCSCNKRNEAFSDVKRFHLTLAFDRVSNMHSSYINERRQQTATQLIQSPHSEQLKLQQQRSYQTNYNNKSKMYTNPFNRKHCTIRQMIDKFLHPDSNNNRKLKTRSSNSSLSSTGSSASSSSASKCSGYGQRNIVPFAK
ncbi:PREDICTED: uncharacterized protein LOC108560372 [Nicrophorus vespilloides]|uniref:Uncharacterized protein LOC108560372 n=1 Tax=Nicrophorus vespilloides TaxID=110193 RepID=A0ABM1MFN1_NICVS|nr:PREDICTED: uncharacterized protein LOC108560372 [Nicrophorus vespilloides]